MLGREPGAEPVIEHHAVVAAHDAVAAAPDRKALPAVDVDAIEKAAGIGSRHLDLAEGRGIEQRDAIPRRKAFAPHRRRHVFLGARVVARPFPLPDILEHRTGRDVPLMHRR